MVGPLAYAMFSILLARTLNLASFFVFLEMCTNPDEMHRKLLSFQKLSNRNINKHQTFWRSTALFLGRKNKIWCMLNCATKIVTYKNFTIFFHSQKSRYTEHLFFSRWQICCNTINTVEFSSANISWNNSRFKINFIIIRQEKKEERANWNFHVCSKKRDCQKRICGQWERKNCTQNFVGACMFFFPCRFCLFNEHIHDIFSLAERKARTKFLHSSKFFYKTD